MKILKIEKLLREEKFEEILEELSEDMNSVDNYNDSVKAGVTQMPEEAKAIMNKMTGLFGEFTIIAEIIGTYKKQMEDNKYMKIKTESAKNNTKFTDASARREASASVQAYRRLRNIAQAYKETCDKTINTCQSTLKYEGIKLNQAPQE